MTHDTPSKVCPVCARTFHWRKKWERDWDRVTYCSDACRKRGVSDTDRRLESAILRLLGDRARDASICPSEAARDLHPDDWRPLMNRTRDAARRLARQGRIVITRKGKPVDPDDARGPIRLRLPR